MNTAGRGGENARTAAGADARKLDRAVAAVLDARTPRELKRTTAELCSSVAPRDLEDAISRRYRPLEHGLLEILVPFLRHGSARRKAMRWLRRTLGELRRWKDAGSWQASSQGPNVTFFCNPAVATREKTLAVGFAGNSLHLMVPTYQVLHALGSQRTDLLLLSDPERNYFAGGVEGLGDDPKAVAAFADAFAKRGGYRRTIALATSAGGLFGIYAALLNGWERAVSVGPDNPENHPSLRDGLKRVAAASKPDSFAQIRICYATRNAYNRENAEAIARILPAAAYFPHDGPDQHNLLEFLADAGELDAYLRFHCFDESPGQR